MKIRHPAVAGYFYESDRNDLVKRIEWCFLHPIGIGKLPAREGSVEEGYVSSVFLAPHAGYMYSGPVASHTYYNVYLSGAPETIVIAGPNHTGMGSLVATMIDASWETPLGRVEVDSELAREIVRESSYLDINDEAHMNEHSVEVQLPFLQYLFGDRFRFVPIVLMIQNPAVSEDLAKAIYNAANKLGRGIIYIASSDWTHYEPHDSAVKKDLSALEYVAKMDPESFYSYIEANNVTACGPGPVMIMMYLAKLMGYSKIKILKYATSGDVTGDKSWVVGYASAVAVK